MVDQLSAVLLALMLVVCAWAYPKLNAWVYRHRVARDTARIASLDERASTDTR